MTTRPVYNDQMRALQARFGTEALADALARHNRREALTPEDAAFLEARQFFFLATSDDQGFPDCSFKGCAPGHLAVVSPTEISFPWLDGNGMFRSLGNIAANPSVGLLFVDFDAPGRLRINGRAALVWDDPRQAELPGAALMVHVRDLAIFSNCPRYIPTPRGPSPHFDSADGPGQVPDWKRRPEFNAALPMGDPVRGAQR